MHREISTKDVLRLAIRVIRAAQRIIVTRFQRLEMIQSLVLCLT